MIDTTSLLLVIAMQTPIDYLEAEHNEVYANFDSLEILMKRLCWANSRQLNRKCDIDTTSARNQVVKQGG